jgi:deoxyadenosine/deoxycytidine kinase
MHIAIAGNIGSGKTTLTSLLAKHFKWEPHYEDVVDNPYLDDFYHQMERWSFNLQIYFKQSFPSSDTTSEKERKSFKTERFMKTLIYLRPTLFDGFDD